MYMFRYAEQQDGDNTEHMLAFLLHRNNLSPVAANV